MAGFLVGLAGGFRTFLEGAGVVSTGSAGGTLGGGGFVFPAAALKELKVKGSRLFFVGGSTLRRWSDWARRDVVVAGDWFRRVTEGESAATRFLLEIAGDGSVTLLLLFSWLKVLANGGWPLRAGSTENIKIIVLK